MALGVVWSRRQIKIRIVKRFLKMYQLYQEWCVGQDWVGLGCLQSTTETDLYDTSQSWTVSQPQQVQMVPSQMLRRVEYVQLECFSKDIL